jgi:outer membrane biogenesis lipoprotein LolB
MHNTRRTALLLLVGALFAGCSSSMPKVAPKVDPARARKTLDAALTAWKEGKAIGAVTEGNEPVVVQDFDWMANKTLMAYEVMGDGTAQDANLRVEVSLTLADAAEPKKVAYIVGTGPKLTVFRAFE